MASNQAINYAPQCGNLTVESLMFYSNNVVGNLSYLKSAPSYHDICKYLINCPLAEALTKSPSLVYQHLLRKFWCTATAYDPNPLINDSEARPLKEYIIKLLVKNGQKLLLLDYKTFVETTRLDYAKGTYIVYSLLTGTKVDIEEIIYSDLITRLTNKSRQRYVSYPKFVSCALEVLLGPDYTQDESFGSSPTIPKKKKGKSQTVTPTLPQSQALEASGSLPQKRKKPQSKKTPTKTKVTSPPKPMEGSKLSHLVSSGTVSDPKDLERNIQLVGAAKITSFPEGPHGEKDSEGFKPPTDMELLTHPYPLGPDVEYLVDENQSTRLRYRSLTRNKSEPSYEGELDNQPLILSTVADVQALLQSNDESDNNVLGAGDEMDEDIPPTDKEAQSSPPNQEQPESPHAQESGSDSSCPEALKKFDIILPLTKRQLVKYIQKISQAIYDRLSADSWDKHKEASISMLILGHPLKAVKEDHALNKKVLEATKAFTANSNNITELLSLTKTFDFSGLKAKSSTSLAWNVGHRLTQNKHTQSRMESDLSSLKKDTSEIKRPANVRGGEIVTPAVTEEHPSHIEGENAYMDTDKAAEKESNTQNLELIQVHIIRQPIQTEVISPLIFFQTYLIITCLCIA
ncbi:hypothetical protein Tco_1331660 [Tanacetum coccineum]